MYKGNKQSNSQAGFTIIELLIATTVFSVVLILVTTGIIRLGQSYFKVLTQNRVQEATRNISEDISRTIQLSSGTKRNGSSPNQFCIGDVRYTFTLNQPATASTPALIADSISPTDACASPTVTGTRELLGQNMRLLRFRVDPDPSGPRTWQVSIRVASGDNDLLTHYKDDGTPNNPATVLTDADTANCKSGIAGSSFCATAQLDTVVRKRLN